MSTKSLIEELQQEQELHEMRVDTILSNHRVTKKHNNVSSYDKSVLKLVRNNRNIVLTKSVKSVFQIIATTNNWMNCTLLAKKLPDMPTKTRGAALRTLKKLDLIEQVGKSRNSKYKVNACRVL